MQAVVLAGGKGTRLAPYTTVFPKPLMPVGEIPILEIIVRQLSVSGFRQLEFATGHLSALLEAYFGDGSRWGVKIRYHREETARGTAGPLASLESILASRFLIMNGDVLTDLDFGALFKAHAASGAILTAATCTRDITLSLGSIVSAADGSVVDYIEKPTYTFTCSSGIYAADHRVLPFIESERPFDIPELVKRLIEARERVGTYAIEGFWLDIGTPDDYRKANEEYLDLISSTYRS